MVHTPRTILERALLLMVALNLSAVVAIASPQTAPPASGPSAREQAGVKLQQAGDWAGALAAFTEAAKAEPENPRIAFGLGASLYETGKPAEAVPALLRAQSLGYQPANQVRYRLARAYLKTGDKAKAYETFDQMAKSGFAMVTAVQHADFNPIRTEPAFEAFVQAVNRNAKPCESDPNFRKFDFWIGEWDVQQTGVPRAPVGASSRVDKILNGCVILENWEPGSNGPAGKSFNTYNTVTKQWEQYWNDASGRITHYKGEFRDDGNLYYEADQFGTANRIRMTFFNEGPNQVRQLGHITTDGGKTWNVSFDLTYIRKK
jgi:tetratricopeptide (TPR) repeat protein